MINDNIDILIEQGFEEFVIASTEGMILSTLHKETKDAELKIQQVKHQEIANKKAA